MQNVLFLFLNSQETFLLLLSKTICICTDHYFKIYYPVSPTFRILCLQNIVSEMLTYIIFFSSKIQISNNFNTNGKIYKIIWTPIITMLLEIFALYKCEIYRLNQHCCLWITSNIYFFTCWMILLFWSFKSDVSCIIHNKFWLFKKMSIK